MEQISTIESRTRASFARVKKDIESLKTQLKRLREREDKLGDALSDYVRSGEFYERIKAIDARFATLTDSYATADEFERGMQRLVKEVAAIDKRVASVESRDLAPEVAALRSQLETLDRATVDKPDFDKFTEKASSRIEGIRSSVDRIDSRLKATEQLSERLTKLNIEQRLEKVDSHDKVVASLAKLDSGKMERRFAAIEALDIKHLKNLTYDPKQLDERVSALEQQSVDENRIRAIVGDSFITTAEMNAKIDEFNAALESASVEDRVAQLEATIAQGGALDEKHVRQILSKELDKSELARDTSALQERLAMIEAAVADVRQEIVTADELNAKIDEFNKASTAVEDRVGQLETVMVDLHDTVNEKRVRQILSKELDKSFSDLTKEASKTHERLSKLEAAAAQHEEFVTADELNAKLEAALARKDEELVTVSELNAKIDEFNAALDTVADEERLAKLEAEMAENGDIQKRLTKLESAVDKSAFEKRLAAIEKRLDNERHATNAEVSAAADQLEAIEKRLAAIEKQPDLAKLNERINDLEAQNTAVLAELGEVQGGISTRVIEDMARDLGKLKGSVESLSEDVELYTKSAKKGADRVESVEHLQSEIEFLRNNVVMQDDIEQLRKQLDAKPEPVKVKRDVTLRENVPLRGPKPAPEPKKKEVKKDEPKKEEKTPVQRVRSWFVDFFTEEVDEEKKDELY